MLDALDVAGVPSLLLKGPALARLLYTAEEHRGYSDIDLLVPPDRLDHARTVFEGLGYTRPGEEFGIDDVAGIQHAELWARLGVPGRSGSMARASEAARHRLRWCGPPS